MIGLFSMTKDVSAANAAADDVRRFGFYGLWLDDAFRGTAVAFGEVELAVADLRNRWIGAAVGDDAIVDDEDCAEAGFGLHWCSLPAPKPGRAGSLFEIAVTGVSVGVGRRDKHLGVGYHRQTLIEVTNDNALVAWPTLPAAFAVEPAQASVQDLLRGSING